MEKQKSIQTIESLYPIDSQFEKVKELGFYLLIDAMKKVGFNWRDLPDVVLTEYAFFVRKPRTAE